MLKKVFTDIFSPFFCVKCFQITDNDYICAQCFNETEFSLEIFCIECKRRRPHTENFLKACCSTSIKSLISFANYENKTISELIKTGKFRGSFEIFKYFGKFISKELEPIKNNFNNFCVVPIPLSKKDELSRGFNQSKILAKIIGEELNLEVIELLQKIKINKPQRTLVEKKRSKNVEGVFETKNKPPKKIILIDDIKTTGATLLEAGKILKTAGAKTIIAITIVK